MMDMIWIGLGIAIAGYCIGEGLRAFGKNDVKEGWDIFNNNDSHELLKENEVHYFLNISKEDARHLIDEYPSIPHMKINGNIYYSKEKLKEWIADFHSR